MAQFLKKKTICNVQFVKLAAFDCGTYLSNFFFNPTSVSLWCKTHYPLRSLVEGDEGCISPGGNLLVFLKNEKIMQHMHGNIQYMFVCWPNPVVHLLLLKSSEHLF